MQLDRYLRFPARTGGTDPTGPCQLCQRLRGRRLHPTLRVMEMGHAGRFRGIATARIPPAA